MPRPLRTWFPGALYHIVARGDNREPVFYAWVDYRYYLNLLAQGNKRYECRVLAYALMTNHVHLVLQTGETHPPAKPVQSMHTAYTMYMHKKYKRVGHIFQGRYHSTLVDKDSYLLELSRYVHLNPVRAGIVRKPEQYEWSSYRIYLGSEHNRLVHAGEVLGLISAPESQQRRLYREFVEQGLTQPGSVPKHEKWRDHPIGV